MTKEMFCARCQAVTTHKGEVDANGEFLFTCLNVVPSEVEGAERSACGRFVKFPADIDKESFPVLVEKHEESNTGQVSLAKQEKKLEEMLGVTEQVAPTPEVAPDVPAPAPEVPEQ